MTGYRRLTVTSPEESFDRLEDEFFVEERTEEYITLIAEDFEPHSDPIFDIVQDMGLTEEYSAHGQGIQYQEDLPEELRDERKYQEEQDRVEPANEEWDDEEVTATLNVLEVIKEKEGDSDHTHVIESAQARLQEIYGSELKPTTDDVQNVYESDVQTALEILSAEGVEYRGRDEYKHPNNVLYYALEFVDNEAKYSKGILPEPRGDFIDA